MTTSPLPISRLRILQTLRQLAMSPLTDETRGYIAKLHGLQNVDDTVRKIISAIESPQQEVRDAVVTVLTAMVNTETQAELAKLGVVDGELPSGQGQVSTQTAKPAVTADEILNLLNPAAAAPAPPTPTAVDADKVAALQQKVLSPTAELPLTVEEILASVELTSTPLNSIEGLETVEIVRIDADGNPTPSKVYSIYRTDRADVTSLAGKTLTKLSGVVLGYRGQASVLNGFGWVYPFSEEKAFEAVMAANHLQQQATLRAPIKLAFEGPHRAGPMVHLDEHAATQPLVNRFLAAHELLSKGYRLFMNVDFQSYAEQVVVSTNPARWFDFYNPETNTPDGAPLSDITTLDFAFRDIAVIGVLLEHKP